MNNQNEFIDLELQSEVAHLRADRDGYRILYKSAQEALRATLTEISVASCQQCNYPLQKHIEEVGGYIPCEYCHLRADRDRLQAIVNQVDDFLITDFIAVGHNDGDYRKALGQGQCFAFNQQIATDPRVNGGSVLFSPDELAVLRRLVDGYFVGPKGQAVLLKLHTKEPDEDTDFNFGFNTVPKPSNGDSTEANT